jgi:hypothetical protein
MATQTLTIAKLAGDAADATIALFREWQGKRLQIEDSREPEQWPESVRREADQWAVRLSNHRHQPPILFYTEYVDLWSFSPADRFLGKEGLLYMLGWRFELYCLPLPIGEHAFAELKKLRSKGQHQEDRLFGSLTLSAIEAWQTMIERAALVFVREVVAGSIDDAEVTASQTGLPSWFHGDD